MMEVSTPLPQTFHTMFSMSFSRCFTWINSLGFIVLSVQVLPANVTLPNLPPGSQYQLVFVSAGTRDALSTNIDDYNSFVTEQANLNLNLPSGITWSAIASTSTVDARDNAVTYDSIPIYNTSGQQVSDGTYHFWGGQDGPPGSIYTLWNSISSDQYGNNISADVWTGSKSDGTKYSSGGLGVWIVSPSFPSEYESPVRGSSTSRTATWISDTVQLTSNPSNMNCPLYAISSPITVIPEPSSLILLSIGIISMLAYILRVNR
jgi:hypothetical protein